MRVGIENVLILFFLLGSTYGFYDELGNNGKVLQYISTDLQDQDRLAFDLDDSDGEAEVKQIIADRRFNNDYLSSDINLFSAIPELFSNEGGNRWAALNLAYQLACYQAEKGNLLSKGLWAYGKYNGYGCYCGGGNYHGNYLDATDHCCKFHDLCYTSAMRKYHIKAGCHTYTTPYTVECCKSKRYTKCTDSGPSAGRALCECDQAMARCVAQKNVLSTYNKSLFNNRNQCQKTSNSTKPYGFMDLLKTCKHANSPVLTFPTTFGSQGTCPAEKSGWWWKKK